MKIKDILTESIPTLMGDELSLFTYVVENYPDEEEMAPRQRILLYDVLDGLATFYDDYGDKALRKVEQKLNFSAKEFFNKYNYKPDPNLDIDNISIKAESFYEYLVEVMEA